MRDALIIAALSPDDWQPLALNGGFSARGGNYTPAARQHSDLIELCGGITGSIGTGGIAVATLPVGMWPASTVDAAGGSSGGTSVVVGISTAGVMTITVAATSSFVVLDGISFRLV